jgi:hypothetical protein
MTEIATNPYIRCVETQIAMLVEQYIKEFDENLKINIVNALIQYGDWHTGFKKPIDIFQYIDEISLDSIRNNPYTYFLLDSTHEGYSQIESHPYTQTLYYNCDKYNIPYHKMLFATSNLRDAEWVQKYNQENNIKNSIKVLEVLAFQRMMYNVVESTYMDKCKSTIVSRKLKKKSYKNYKDKIFLSLSRVNRHHRTLANFLLYSHDLINYGLCSQDTISSNHIISHLYPNINTLKFNKFRDTLPYIADTTDFETNHADNMNTDLYSKTLFEIANETMVKDYNGTSLFYSEKTFKPIANFQPFIIFGQQHCNQKLQEYGFKLYDKHFDYEFDNEPDTYTRYMKIIKQLQALVIKINQMSRDEKLAWKYQSEDILLHNFKRLQNYDLEKKSFFNLFKQIKKDNSIY